MMDRRKFIAMLSSSAAASTAAVLPEARVRDSAKPASRKTQERISKPNVIVLICDDLGYGDVGCYGSHIPTPNLDAMALEGIRCTHHNSAHPICSASRAALLTGRYGHRSGTYGAFGPASPTGTSRDETMLSNLFQNEGYKTRAIGKWHLGSTSGYFPTDRGFDSFYGVPYSDDLQPLPLLRDTTVLEPDTDRTVLTRQYTEEAIQYIEKTKSPFFLYLGYSYPHHPAAASKEFQGKTRLGNFGDCVAEIDWSVGEIRKAVHRAGLMDDTLILFTSDHGPWYQGSPGALRGRKASTFEGGVRVPFLVAWPGTVQPHQIIDEWSCHLDILPTLSTLCGLKLPDKPLDGVDKSAAMLGFGAQNESKHQLYFSALSGNASLDVHCIRKGSWKLRMAQGTHGEIYVNDRTGASKGSAVLTWPELYDLSVDPAEAYDVAEYHPELVQQLKKELEEAIMTFPAPVTEAYSHMHLTVGDPSTPAGAAPRLSPAVAVEWVPKNRR